MPYIPWRPQGDPSIIRRGEGDEDLDDDDFEYEDDETWESPPEIE
jgi:hypothetical protein